MIIDMFCHFLPLKAISSYLKQKLPFLLRFIEPTVINYDDYRFVDPEYRIKYMDKFGIDMEVLTVPYQSLWETLNPDEALKIAKTVNEALSDLSQKYSERFSAAAVLPYLTGEALDELDKCIFDLGLKGVLIFSNSAGKPLGSPEFEPFYEKMEKYDLPVWVHPAHWPYYPWFGYKYDLTHVFGYPFETAIAAASIVYGGVLKRHPKLKIILHHLGGIIPLVSGRIEDFYEMAVQHPHIFGRQYEGLDLKPGEKITDYFKLMYADTVVCGSQTVFKLGYEFYGPKHLVFGTDYPFGPEKGEKWTRENLKIIKETFISEEEKIMIFEENARRLLKI